MIFSKYSSDDLPFSDVALPPSDVKRLRYLADNTLHANEHDVLCRNGLAYEIRDTNIPGGMPVPTGRIAITDRGRSYLLYRHKETRRFWIPVSISLFALLLSSCSIVIDVIQLISSLM